MPRLPARLLLLPVFILATVSIVWFNTTDLSNLIDPIKPTIQATTSPSPQTFGEKAIRSDQPTPANPLPNSTASSSNSPSTHTPSTQPQSLPIVSYAVASGNRTATKKTAGTVTTITLHNLQPMRIYKVALTTPSFLGLDILWTKGTVSYALGAENTAPPLHEVELFTEEEIPVGELLYSETLFPDLRIKPEFAFIQVSEAAETVQLKLLSPSTKPLPTNTIAATGVYNRDSGAKYSGMRIVSRQTWGADLAPPDIDDPSRLTWNPQYYRANRIVIHHTVTPNRPSNPEQYVRAVYLSHANSRGWGDVGYNYLIDHLGNIYEGKFGGDETLGYHAFGAANTMSVGISLLGDFTSVMPSSEAQTALKKFMAERAALYGFSLRYGHANLGRWLNPSYTVFGHRDAFRWYDDTNEWGINATACPGNTFYPRLPSLVTEAEGYRATHFDSIKQVVQQVEADLARPHESGTLLVTFAVPPETPEEQVRALIPAYSGITITRIRGNKVVIKTEPHLDPDLFAEGISEWVVPPAGWSGYDAPNVTFFPVSQGAEDRLRTLYKIFKLDPMVSTASLNFGYGL